MPFDDAQYTKNRANGLRGQGSKLTPTYRPYISAVVTPSLKPPGKKALRKNTRRARRWAARQESQ